MEVRGISISSKIPSMKVLHKKKSVICCTQDYGFTILQNNHS